MRRAVLLLLSWVLAASAAPKPGQRIVGGELTTIDQYPFQAALLFSWNLVEYSQSCGAIILNERSVLTAAHCVWDYPNILHYRIRVGSTFANSGGVVHSVVQLITHPTYNSSTQDCDLAIVRLTAWITFNNYARPATIAGTNYDAGDNQVVWATGWGFTALFGPPSEQLRHVQVYTISQEDCRARYSVSGITDNMLCSGVLDEGGRDQCTRDSGGPLLHHGVVVGVCSWGFGCASPLYPGVNVRVARFTTWIQANA